MRSEKPPVVGQLVQGPDLKELFLVPGRSLTACVQLVQYSQKSQVKSRPGTTFLHNLTKNHLPMYIPEILLDEKMANLV